LLVEAHFDESGTDAKEVTVAGYIFEAGRLAEFSEKWKVVLQQYNLPFFHMVDCAHGNKTFAHLKQDRNARSAIQLELMRLIRRYAVNGIIANISNNKEDRKGSYLAAAEAAARAVISWSQRTAYDGKVAYFFEQGATGEGALKEFFSGLDQEQRQEFLYQSHTFSEKADSPAVQAADLLAWQYHNFTKKRETKDLARLDLRYLLRTPHLIDDSEGDPPRESRCESIAESRVRRETIYYLPRKDRDPEGGNFVLLADVQMFSGKSKGSILACPACRRAVAEDITLKDIWFPNNITKSMQVKCWCGTWCGFPKTAIPCAP